MAAKTKIGKKSIQRHLSLLDLRDSGDGRQIAVFDSADSKDEDTAYALSKDDFVALGRPKRVTVEVRTGHAAFRG